MQSYVHGNYEAFVEGGQFLKSAVNGWIYLQILSRRILQCRTALRRPILFFGLRSKNLNVEIGSHKNQPYVIAMNGWINFQKKYRQMTDICWNALAPKSLLLLLLLLLLLGCCAVLCLVA